MAVKSLSYSVILLSFFLAFCLIFGAIAAYRKAPNPYFTFLLFKQVPLLCLKVALASFLAWGVHRERIPLLYM